MADNLYGTDLILVDGDLATNAAGDLMSTQDYEDANPASSRFPGYHNILFSLLDRLSTIKGDNVFHPEYGATIKVSAPNSPMFINSLKEAIQDCLLEDPRIKSVEAVNVKQIGREASAEAVVILEGKDSTSSFIFPNFLIE